MTKDNAQKQAIRARMAKTGERYTTARHYLLDLHRQEHANVDVARSSSDEGPDSNAVSPAPREGTADAVALIHEAAPAAVDTVLPPRVAEPGVSDASVHKATGKSWDEWFSLLDA